MGLSKQIWSFGDNSRGQLGDNTIDNKSSPVSVVRSGSYTTIDVGYYHSLIIDDLTGMVWSCGENNQGQLGNGTTDNQSSPVSIARSGSYVAIAAGFYHSVALDSAGIVWAWGLNDNGQLGDGTTDPQSSPISIARSGSYSSIEAGDTHSLAIDSTGMVWAWGLNDNGQLGDGTTDPQSSPISIARSGSYIAIEAGWNYSVTIDSNGIIWTCGRNLRGQLGDNTTDDKSSPVSIVRSGSYTAIAAGEQHILAIDSTGMVWAWGFNHKGQLGNKSIVNQSSPISIVRSGSYTAIAAGTSHSLAIDSAGMVWAWGNDEGELGNSRTTGGRSYPVAIAQLGSYTKVAAGRKYSFILGTLTTPSTPATNTWCWGNNLEGELGDNTLINTSSPVAIARGSYSAIVGGQFHGLAIDAFDGSIWSWGDNGYGQLGIGSLEFENSPVSIVRLGSYTMISASGSCSFAIDASDGSIWSWGVNTYGQLGNNSTDPTSSPVSIVMSGSFSSVTTGSQHSLAINASDGSIWSWGYNTGYGGPGGQLGDNSTTTKSSPVSVVRSGSYAAIAAGNLHSLAIDASDGSLWSFGSNRYGQLGDFTISNKSSPVSVSRSGSYVAVAAGYEHSLALDSAGMVWAWGLNAYGQLGIGSVNNQSSPVSIARSGSYVAIAAGLYHSLSIDSAGIVLAWGDNTYGQLGNSSLSPTSSPVSIAKLGTYIKIGAGWHSSYALKGPNKSISYFNQSSVVDNASVQSNIHNDILISTIQSHYTDTYFDDIAKVTVVVVYYVHQDGRQVKKVYHESSSLIGNSSWTNFALDGTWSKNKITVFNHDGATHDLPRSIIGTAEDITHSDGTTNLNIY